MLVALMGCGGEDLTCELLADPTNCWASAASEAAACLPLHTEVATMSADRTRCEYSDGSYVEFDAPLPTDPFDFERLALTAHGDGCTWRFVDTFANRMELTTSEGTVVAELHDGESFHLHCPDTTYESSFDLLFTCQPPARAPTDGFDVDATTFTFTIASVSTPTPLIQCALP